MKRLKGWLVFIVVGLLLLLPTCKTYLSAEEYAKTHVAGQDKYCWTATSTTETDPFWGGAQEDRACVYANPFDQKGTGNTLISISFGQFMLDMDLFPKKTVWDDGHGAWKYYWRAVYIPDDWVPFGPQWGIELVYNIGVPDRQIEEGWELTLGNTTGGKGFETYTGEDGKCYIRKIPDDRSIRIFVPVR